MSKGRSKPARPVPELQDGAASPSPGSDQQSTSRGSSARLPSLRPKRDLSLGAMPPPRNSSKKTFTPTIPVRRKKAAASPATAPTDEGTSGEKGRGKRERGRGRGRGGRGRRDRDVITSASVFSMGPAERLMQKRESVGETFGSSSRSAKSEKINVKSEDLGNKYHLHFSDEEGEEGEGVEDAGPMDTGEELLFRDSKLPPIQLPLDYSLHGRQKTVSAKNRIIKQEIEEDSKVESAPVKLVKPAANPVTSQATPERITAAKLFTPSQGSKGQFLFFQLPDCLPFEGGGANSEVAMDTSTAAQSAASAVSSSDKREDEAQQFPSLRDLPDGLIGKIRVHKSGKVKLVLGDSTLDISMGTPCGFLQELVSIDTGEGEGEGEREGGPSMIVLGQPSHRLICTPDFEALLSSCEAPSPAVNDSSTSPSSDHKQPR